ncbi:MAG: effector protein, partial [Pseudomonadota bacterium]
MTVETETVKVTGAGNDAATSFSFSPVVLFASTDLVVTHVDADDVETALTEDVDYTVVVSAYPGTGSITYPVSGDPLPTGESLIMKRILDLNQDTDLENQGGYFADVLEQAL